MFSCACCILQKIFFKITKPLCDLLVKDILFESSHERIHAFETLKGKLVFAPIIVALDQELTFEFLYVG